MSNVGRSALIFLIFGSPLLSQPPLQSPIQFVATDPSGACGNAYITVNISSGHIYTCVNNIWTIVPGAGGGSGTVTGFTSGALSPLFTTSVSAPNSTPALSFALNSQTANTVFSGPNGSSGLPAFRLLLAPDIPAALANTTSVNGTTIPSAVTLLYSGSPLGTPSSGIATHLTGLPTSALIGTLAAAQAPAYTGDMISAAGSLTTAVNTIGGKAVSLAGSFTTTGAFNPTLQFPATGTWIFPSAGTLVNTLGNVATATNLASYPTICSGVQFSQGLSSGSNNCATPAGGGNVSNSGTPAAFQIPVWTNSTSIAGITPSATSGVPLISQGSSTNPAFGAINLAGGSAIVTGVLPSGNIPILNQNTLGNAATATALAAAPTLCTSGQAPTGILASGNATGCASLGSSVYTPPFTLPSTRTSTQGIADRATILDYANVDPTNTADSTAAIQGALSSDCGVIYDTLTIPVGTYKITGQLYWGTSNSCNLIIEAGAQFAPYGPPLPDGGSHFVTYQQLQPIIPFPSYTPVTSASSWSNLTAPSTNLSLSMAANTSAFIYASPLAGAFSWTNSVAATSTVGASGPNIYVSCGHEWHAGASTAGCASMQFVSGNGTDANNEIVLNHIGTATGTTNTIIPGPLLTSTIKDANGNPFIASSATASAVDSISITNASTADPATVVVSGTGADGSINLRLNSKGTGVIQAGGVSGLPTPQTGTVIQEANTNNTPTRHELDCFDASCFFSAIREDGTAASPTALLSGEQMGGYNGGGYNGASISEPMASLRSFASQNWSVGATGTYIDFTTTPNGTATAQPVLRLENDGGIDTPGVTGGDKGAGTINAAGLYVNGVAVGAGSASAATPHVVTFSTTPNFPCGSATGGTVDDFRLSTALSANVTSSTISGCTPGQVINLTISQAATGGPYTFSVPTGFDACTMNPTAGTVTTCSYWWDGTLGHMPGGPGYTCPGCAAADGLPGNTGLPALLANAFYLIGPNTNSFTTYGLQFSSTAPAANNVLLVGAPVSGVAPVTFGTVPPAALTNPSIAVNGQVCTLGSLCSVNRSAATSSVALNESSVSQLGGVTLGPGTVLQGASGGGDPVAASSVTLGVSGTTTGQLELANGGTSGAIVALQNNAATATYNFNLPATAGLAGQVLTSQAGVANPMTWTGIPAGVPTYTAGSGVTSCTTTVGYANSNTRGEITVVGSAATAGTICTVNFSTTLASAPGLCMVTQEGGVSAFGIGHGVPSTSGFTVTSAVNLVAGTVAIDYNCLP